MPCQIMIRIVTAVLCTVYGQWAFANNTLAIKQFESALFACERGLQAKMPKSKGSLKVLQSLFARYQKNRDEALKVDGTLKNATNHLYKGTFFAATPFREAFQTCENQLAAKIAQAETGITQKYERIQAQSPKYQAELETLNKKVSAAMPHIDVAIQQQCITYLKNNSGDPKAIKLQYEAAKKQALNAFTDIDKQFYTVRFKDPDTGEERQIKRRVKTWFKQCEDAFSGKQVDNVIPPNDESPTMASESTGTTTTGDEEGPMLPPPTMTAAAANSNTKLLPPAATPATTSPEADPDYEYALKTVEADRLTTLQTEKRLPDFTNNDEDDDLTKSTIWQYENENGSECRMYHFKGNKLEKTDKLKKECPLLN